MSVIDSYLDTLFAPYPDTPRLREARAELRTMMEDQQQALRQSGHTESQAVGTVIAEFGSLEEVAAELGISQELGGSAPAAPEAAPRPHRDHLEAYQRTVRESAWISAIGTPLFVLSPVPLLALIALTGPDSGGSGWAIAVGLATLLVMVAAGVALLSLRGSRLEDFQDIEEGRFALDHTTREFAREVRRTHRGARTGAQAVATSLWILCVTPILLTALLSGDSNSGAVLLGVCLTLILVALGLLLSTWFGWSEHVAGTLLAADEATEMPETSASPAIRVIASIYWPLVVAVYLAWSFATGDWRITWMVWPVAGVLYAALWGANSALTPQRPEERATRARAS
jgi:hypothetical protein